MINPFISFSRNVYRAAKLLDFDDERKNYIIEAMTRENRTIKVDFNVQLDNGKKERFVGFISQHYKPKRWGCIYKGGLRIHRRDLRLDTTLPEDEYIEYLKKFEDEIKDVENEVRALAGWMTIKTAVLGMPYGGAKGAIVCDPDKLSKAELERVFKRFTEKVYENIGPEKYSIGPDVLTGPREMEWIMEQYSASSGVEVPGVVTGKSLERGGIKGREDATSRGCLVVLDYFINKALIKCLNSLDNSRLIIQGTGNVGGNLIKILSRVKPYDKNRVKVIGVADITGAYYKPDGFNLENLVIHLEKERSIKNFNEGSYMTTSELMSKECEVLVPAAIENTIVASDEITKPDYQVSAEKINTCAILEAANGPTSPKADDILLNKGVTIIPDVLVNGGGVYVPGLEVLKNNGPIKFGDNVDEEGRKVYERLKKVMHRSVSDTITEARRLNTKDFRIAAYALALRRIQLESESGVVSRSFDMDYY